MLIFITAITVALVVSFLCSIFESVLLSIGPAQVEALASAGKRSGRILKDFKDRIDVPIAAILIVNTIAHTIGATVAGASYVDVFSEQTLWLFSVVFTAAVLLFTEIIPKTLGVTYRDALATPVAYSIHWLTLGLKPLVALTAAISQALRGNKEIPVITIEEIRLLTALGRNEGIVGPRTAGIIVGATRLSELRAIDVIVPRQQVKFLSGEQNSEEVLDTIRSSGHSRFPFSATGELDEVSGVILAKDLLFQLQKNSAEGLIWKELLREPLIIPASRSLNSLLKTFKEERRHMAIVVDEYGGTEGIVTLEDILEELVGEIVDESDHPVDDLWPQRDGSVHALATIELRKVCEHLGAKWERDENATSLGGLVTSLLGRIPVKGDILRWNEFELEVLAATERRAEIIKVSRIS
jgi:CBS domain containing-hemolysin-like protein